MNSLFERALARPYFSSALLLLVIAIIAVLWWLLCPAASTSTTTINTTKIVTNAPNAQSNAQPLATASATMATSEVTQTESVTPVVTANTAHPTDPALAEEELDRLNDEHARLKDRKAQLAKQLEISNKLLAMKEQQLKTLETPNP